MVNTNQCSISYPSLSWADFLEHDSVFYLEHIALFIKFIMFIIENFIFLLQKWNSENIFDGQNKGYFIQYDLENLELSGYFRARLF